MIYFDNAATTLRKPRCVIEAVTEAMGSMGNSGRGVHSGALIDAKDKENMPVSIAIDEVHRGLIGYERTTPVEEN